MATALITGASAGLGAEFAKLFATDKHDVILVARRRARLESLARDLEAQHAIRAHVIEADLASPSGVDELLRAVQALGVEVEFLVNNAGYGAAGAVCELDAARQLEMVQLNVSALLALTRALVPSMIARRRGRVLNIGSTAGFQPGPFMAVYYASKAFVISFTEALAHELHGTGVSATVSCPGATATEFSTVAGNDNSRLFRAGAASAEQVAREAYRAMMVGRPMVVHGLRNRLGVQLLRISPRAAVRRVAAALNAQAKGTKSLPG